MSDLSVTYDANGPVALTSDELRTMLVDEATALSPGLTTDLPASLIEDMASTGTGGLLSIDQMRIDTLNGVGPNSANLALLTLQAQQYGARAQMTEGYTSVNVVFTGTPYYMVPKGFIVSDGTYQYATTEAVTLRSSGTSASVNARATITGAWAVVADSVVALGTSIPATITLTVTNPTAGTPASDAETNAQFRARIWNMGMAALQGSPEMIMGKVGEVDNVTSRLVSVVQQTDGWIVMCGGGDNVDMANAIFISSGDFTRLKLSSLNVTGITQANPGVVSTDLTHGFTTGQIIQIAGIVGMTELNGVSLTVTVIDPHSFSIGTDTTSYTAWASGGVVTPNLRNTTVSINNVPDIYTINYVQPLQQLTTVTFQWASQTVNYIADNVLLSLSQTSVITYINSLRAGAPLNLNKLKDIFLQAINSTYDMTLITTLNVIVTVNGIITAADSGTNIISGDRYSYFYVSDTGVSVEAA